MHLGIFSYNVEYGARPDELARAAEERGFESFWVGEHTHIPASRLTPYPGGEPLPKPYYHMADPFVSLMAAAAARRAAGRAGPRRGGAGLRVLLGGRNGGGRRDPHHQAR